MLQTLKKARIFNGNTLKIIASITMLIDHIGVLFYFYLPAPQYLALRIIGRLSMPLFAFMIAEGCRYTKNKLKHFLLMFGLGAGCQLVYYFFSGDTYLNILLTFSLSALICYVMDFFKTCLFAKDTPVWKTLTAAALFVGSIAAAYALCRFLTFDYGFWGVMMPVFANIFNFHRIPVHDKLKKLDVLPLRILCFAIAIVFCMLTNLFIEITVYSLLTLPLLLLYNGEKGKRNMKYFFYVFYPLHLAALEGVYMLLSIL